MGNTAIVGVNGTGKSTIIDAIQMLLLGYKSAKFNANANAEKRTLESYVRGAVNTDEKEFLRPGDVISYLALEIELNGVKHIFGINLEYTDAKSKLDNRYFYIKNTALTADMFVSDNYPIAYRDFSREIRKENDYTPFPTQLQYHMKMKDILGLKDEEKYYRTLSRAVGIKNITDCNTFMNEFVLDESNIDVSSIKNNILEMSKVNKTIEETRCKLIKLDEVASLGADIRYHKKEVELASNKINLCHKILLEKEIEFLTYENEVLNRNYEKENILKQEYEERHNNLNLSKIELKKMLEEISPNLAIKEKELEEVEKKHYEAKLNLNSFKVGVENQLSSLYSLKKFNNAKINEFISYLKKGEYTSSTCEQMFREFRNEANNEWSYYLNIVNSKKDELDKIRNDLIELEDIINKLKNNILSYDKKYIDFVNYIKENLTSISL